MKIKSLFNIMAVAALACSMAACSGSKSSENDSDDSDKSDKKEKVKDDKKDEPSMKMNVTFDIADLGTMDDDGVVEVTDDEMFLAYMNSTNRTKPVIIDCGATWCGPCQKFKPVFHEVAKANKDKVEFYYVDVDNNPKFAEANAISAVPALFVVLPDGSKMQSAGALSKSEFEQFVASAL